MLNQVIVVGRLVREPKKDGLNTYITVAVPRSWKNDQGVYDTDFIDCILSGNIALNTAEFCFKGDLIGIKGRLETRPKTNDEGFQNGREMVVIADKVTFLSSKKKEEE